ncbi:hypothetical protein V495_01934 [Pseudogymnoascus sp. VKM F-4514 (FW-929)]|nr:hypothetical protein V495_01934 [Pseudogymnoascus sp. VKM F-4514 (FW-929)]KFY56717.1 hypothetical protein V497_06054 [Pseudogymnoascus sp. VKM F-4516 (FW-969)]
MGNNGEDAIEKKPSHVIGANRPDFTAGHRAGKDKASRGSVEQIENAGAMSEESLAKKPRGCFARFWLHFKRRWCYYAIGLVIFLAIILPVFFLVAFPAIAQKMVNDADLPIYSASITNPTPDSVQYSLKAGLAVPKPFTVKLKPIALNLLVDQNPPNVNPYVTVNLPEQNLKGNSNITITNQTTNILDQGIFGTFLHSAVYQETFVLSASGETDAYVGKLKAHIHLDKKVELKGLNKLKGFGIESARAVLPPQADGTNLIADLQIPNASLVSFELGNVTLNIFVGGVLLGNATMYNVYLVPGENIVPARGIINLKTAIMNLPTILQSQVGALTKGNIEMSASGNSTIYNGQHIEYFEKVLNSLMLTTQMPLLAILMDSLKGILGGDGGSPLPIGKGMNITSIIPLIQNLTSIIGI